MPSEHPLAKKIAAAGGILFFFVMAFEVMIMISPFAFFFYSVFSPVFNFLGAHAGDLRKFEGRGQGPYEKPSPPPSEFSLILPWIA